MEPKVGQILCWEEIIDGVKGIKGNFIIRAPNGEFRFNFTAKYIGNGRPEYEGDITTSHTDLVVKQQKSSESLVSDIQKYSFDDLEF